MGANVLPRTRRHARPSRLSASRTTHLRDDATKSGNENENGGVANSKSPSQLRRASSLHSRFTLRDLMHAPNAPLAQLRSPLRRADSMANRSVGFGNGFQNAAANPFPPRKRKPAPLKALLRRGENTHTFDRENSDPTRDVGAVGIRENSDTPTNATTEGRPSAATRAPPPTIRTTRAASDGGPSPFSNDADSRRDSRRDSQPDSPAFVAAVPGELKRKAANEPTPEPLSSESFSFFGDETTKPASSEAAVSARERELLAAIRNEKAAAAAARASMSLGRWRLALATQKARAETAAKTATLTEMLRDQAREFDADKRSRKEELRGALTRNGALTRELADRDEAVELLTEALGAATRERVAAQWRFSAKAATARAEAASARRKMRRVAVESMESKRNGSADAARHHDIFEKDAAATDATARTTNALRLPEPNQRDDHLDHLAVRASVTEALREEIREELRVSLRKEVIKELRKSLRPIVEAEVRAEARELVERQREALGGYARMAKIGLEVNEKKWRRDGTAATGQETKRTRDPKPETAAAYREAFAPAPPRFYDARAVAAVLTVDGQNGQNGRNGRNGRGASPVPRSAANAADAFSGVSSSTATAMAAAAATRGCLVAASNADARTSRENPSATSATMATRVMEAAARARSRLNPLKGANVEKLVALHEAAAAKLAQQAEELVHEAEHVFFEPFAHTSDGPKRTALSERETAVVVEGAVIDVARIKKDPDDGAPRAFPPRTALTPTTGARVVVPEACEPTTRRAKARENSVWDMWYR